jgi:hypothetical protein
MLLESRAQPLSRSDNPTAICEPIDDDDDDYYYYYY